MPIVRVAYGYGQSITKVFICICYVSLMYRLSYTQVSKQNRNRIEAESDFSFAQIKKKQYFFRRIVRLRID